MNPGAKRKRTFGRKAVTRGEKSDAKRKKRDNARRKVTEQAKDQARELRKQQRDREEGVDVSLVSSEAESASLSQDPPVPSGGW